MLREALKLNLQFFADDAESNDENDNQQQDTKNEADKKYTEDEFKEKLDVELKRRLKQKDDEKQKEIEEAKRLAKLTKDEKKDYELEKLKKQVAALNEEKALSSMKDVARDILSDKGVSATSELLNLVVTSDAEQTKNNVDAFVEILDKAVEKKVNEALRQNAPKNIKQSGLTKKDILAIEDDEERQKMIAQNINLFK